MAARKLLGLTILLLTLDARADDPESYRLRCIYPSGLEVRCNYACRAHYVEEFVAECERRDGEPRRIER